MTNPITAVWIVVQCLSGCDVAEAPQQTLSLLNTAPAISMPHAFVQSHVGTEATDAADEMAAPEAEIDTTEANVEETPTLACQLRTEDGADGTRVTANLVAADSGASGEYAFSFVREGASSVSIVRRDTFDLGPNEVVELSTTMMEGNTTVEANLEVNGEAVTCHAP